MEPLVEIKNLSIRFPEGNSTFEAVKGISFSIGKGEIVGVVGESGSGKSMSALALMGLLPKDAEIASGSLCFQGEDLVTIGSPYKGTVEWSQWFNVNRTCQ